MFVQPYVSFGGVISDTLPGHLAKNGHQVEVVSFSRDKGRITIVPHEENVRFHWQDAISISIPKVVAEFPYFLFLRETIEQVQPDLIHINNLPFLTTFQSARLAKVMRKRSIVQVHGIIGDKGFPFNSLQEAYIFTFGRSIFNNANMIICLTLSEAQKLRGYACPPGKIRIIANGVDIEKFSPLGNEMPKSLLWCGRFVHQKGLEYLIEAMRILVKERNRIEIKLVMTGAGPLLPNIYQMVRKYKLTDNVVFRGYMARNEIPRVINESSLCVLPSLSEGMPYFLLEAMACGKAIIGSDIPGINNVIMHNATGFLVPPRNSNVLANSIWQLLDDENLRKKLGQRARQLIIEKFSWTKITKEVERVYEETIQE